MQQKDSSVKKIILMLSANYSYWGKDHDESRMISTIGLYERFLSDIPAEVLEMAALAHIAESRFFPTVAELREKSIDILVPNRKTALEAWFDKDDPVAQKVKRLLPDYNAREITLKEQAVIKSLFLKYYEQIVERERKELKQLPEVRAMMAKIQHGPSSKDVQALSDPYERIFGVKGIEEKNE